VRIPQAQQKRPRPSVQECPGECLEILSTDCGIDASLFADYSYKIAFRESREEIQRCHPFIGELEARE
jgi:hypothetical protein